MTTQETLAQIEHLLVEHEETLKNELAKILLDRLIGMACSEFLECNRNTDKHWKEIPEAVEMMTVVKWLKKIKQEMKYE